MNRIWPPPRPSQWGLRVRSALLAGVIVALAVGVGALLLTLLLYRSLISAADDAATARIQDISAQLESEGPAGADPATVTTTSSVTLVQILDAAGTVVRASPSSATTPVTSTRPAAQRMVHAAAPTELSEGLRVSAYTTEAAGGPYTIIVATSMESVEHTIKLVALLVGVGAPFIVASAALATYGLVGRSLRSVERIRTRVAAISSSDLAERVPVPVQRDEIAALAETMNHMLARLESGQQAQRRFIADASHELRSPLATVRAALEIGRDRPALLDQALIDETLLPETGRMQHLIDDLLTLARADEKGLPLRIVDVDLDDVVEAEIRRPRAAGGPAILGDITPARIRGDAGQLARIARNLIDNAARYAETTIRVRVTADPGGVCLEVSDDGPGIPEADRERVFERFYRLHDDRGRGTGGSGLGLAIVAELVAAHHGTVRVGASPTGGAAVSVRLPLAGPDQAGG